MSLDLLDAPLRATWDLWDQGHCLPDAQALSVCEKICDAGLFFLTLGRRPLMHPALEPILFQLAGSGIRRTLLTGAADAELRVLSHLSPDNEILLDLDPLAARGTLSFDALEKAVAAVRTLGFEPGLALTPLRDHLQYLPGLFRLCRRLGLERFKLPNMGINVNSFDSQRLQVARPQDIEVFAELMRPELAELAGGPLLEVHDLFLWEILASSGEQGRSEYGGCQAGNSLAHIDCLGHLHPCASWLLDLGSLLEADFSDLWDTAMRYHVREEVAAVPAGCAGCKDYPGCLGGCRGLSLCLGGPGQGRDLMCGGRR